MVPGGAAYGFLGHNGAGKTTLIRMLLGLTRASAGSASVLGLPVPGERAQALARVLDVRRMIRALVQEEAGGLHNYARLLDMLGVFTGPVAAVLIGAEAGAGGLAAGVFRDNVLTGRSRLALFAARSLAAVAVSLAAIALGFAVGVAATFGFAGGLPTPSASLILQSAAWLALANAVVCVVSIGLASLTGSRPGTITALISWQLVLSPLLVRSSALGSLHHGLLDGVLLFLKPGPASGAPTITMSVAVAILCSVCGCWWLRRQSASSSRDRRA